MSYRNELSPPIFPQNWASDWGEDEYGLWMALNYKDVEVIFRWLLPCEFLMGSPKNEKQRFDKEKQHLVRLTRGYWLAETTVTQALWEVVIENNPSRFKGQNHPVDSVSWLDCEKFINKFSSLHLDLTVRLPTEAEWENACRAGTTTPFSFGENINFQQVNYNGKFPYNNAKKGLYREKTVEVKSLPANAWGLHEMHGNVWEWCQDWFGEYPKQALIIDSKEQETGNSRVLRGGSWLYDGKNCRCATRSRYEPNSALSSFGFRLSLGHLSSSQEKE